MKTIHLSDLVDQVRKVAAQYPDFIYTKTPGGRCLYGPTKKNPHGCIMGKALQDLGLPLPPEGEGISTFLAHAAEFLITPDDQARLLYWLDEVQAAQDSGVSWGQAVSDATLNPRCLPAY